MKYIKIPKDFFKKFNFKLKVPTFTCSCGEKVLDTPTNRAQSLILNDGKYEHRHENQGTEDTR